MSPAEYEALLLAWTKDGASGTAVVDATAAQEWLLAQPEDAVLPFPADLMTRLPFPNMWFFVRTADGGVSAGWFVEDEDGWVATWTGLTARMAMPGRRALVESALADEPSLRIAVHRVKRVEGIWRASGGHDYSAILVGLLNVTNLSCDFVAASRTARKIAAQAHPAGEGPTQYRKLYLRPFAAVGEDEQQQRERTALMPWHLVRGHFVTYTAERPLFGRYTGTFWVPAHARGNPSVGRRVKTYVIEPAIPTAP